MRHATKLAGALMAVAAAPQAGAALPPPAVSIEILSRGPAFDGAAFGAHGAYETIVAVAHLRIDPAAAGNRGIVDLDRAPRGPDRRVAYDVDLQILRPRDPAKARRVLVYDVVNRGMKLIGAINGAKSMVDPGPGTGFLMRQGYTVVWSGWQGDITGKGLLGARFPVATDGDKPLTGTISTERIFDDATSDELSLAYPAASLDQAGARLTVRARTADAERPLPAAAWRFVDATHVRLARPARADAGAIYRFTYTARDPKVMGLGFAAVRDLVSFLRHADAGAGNPLADIAGAPCERDVKNACVAAGGGAFDAAVAIGVSQSGRYLRDFLWQGFNRDLAGVRVFDGMLPIIPGARRTFTNLRFAEPGRFSRQHEDHDVPGFDFPFTYASLADPATGRRDGILRACAADDTCPKLFHIDTSGEFWQAGASLVGTGGTARDVAFPANVRAYMIAGGAHAPGITAPACVGKPNPMNYYALMRALLVDMVDWTTARAVPPASRWPSVGNRELVPVPELRAPDLTTVPNGTPWASRANTPPAAPGAGARPVLVPAVDADGIDRAGIRLPPVAAPTGTYLGWNLRRAGYAEGDLCFVYGTYVPFAADAATRGHDPRRSLAERYAAPDARGAMARAAAKRLVADRLLLDEDVAELTGDAPTR